MVATMLELMDDHIPSLAVHDSIIVPVLKEQRGSVLTDCYRKITRATPFLVSHFPQVYETSDDPWNVALKL
jgi:hypothetical protein